MAKTESPKRMPAASQTGLSYSGAMDISRSRHVTLANKATRFLSAGQLESARKIYMDILNENEDDVFALHGIALVAREMKRLPVAVSLLQKLG